MARDAGRLVLKVHERHAPLPLFEQGHRVLAGHAHPKDIHLELHQVRVQAFQEDVDWPRAFLGTELESVVMVAELHPGFARSFPGFVELVGIAAKLVERAALGGHQISDHHILHAGLRRLIHGFLPRHPGRRAMGERVLPGVEVSRHQRRRKVPADRLQPELLA